MHESEDLRMKHFVCSTRHSKIVDYLNNLGKLKSDFNSKLLWVNNGFGGVLRYYCSSFEQQFISISTIV